MRIDIGDTECEQILKIRTSTEALLARLHEHHDYSVPIPPLETKAEKLISFDEWVERQRLLNPLPKKLWFSVEAEIDPAPLKVTVKSIQRTVAQFYGVTDNDLICDRRTAKIVLPRHIAMYLSKMLTLLSLPEIGRRFGYRDHSSVHFAVNKIAGLRASNATLAEELNTIAAAVGGSLA